MKSLSREIQVDIIEAFNSTLKYLDDLLNIDNIYFDQMVDCIYPTELLIPVLVLLFVALRFILRGDLFYVLPCVTLFLCFPSF